jgi:hypothetical protein
MTKVEPTPLKVRTTIPGQSMGLREWSEEELVSLIASYQASHRVHWEAYLKAEREQGFITNLANEHIMSHLSVEFPGLHPKHYQIGAVDFRFFNNRQLGFQMWKPNNRHARSELYWTYVKETQARQQSVILNGHVEWTGEQIACFVEYLQEQASEFWNRICLVYDKVGFGDAALATKFADYAANVFALPQDLDCATISAGVIEEADRLFHFEMLKPQNRETRAQLYHRWINQSELGFEEWFALQSATSKSPE